MLSFRPCTDAASDKATETVLTAAGACSKLQRLCVGTEYIALGLHTRTGKGVGLRSIPGSLAALGSLTTLELQRCGLLGPQQLLSNLVDLRLDDRTCAGYTLPASLAAMTALTRLTANHAQRPPPVWPPRLIFLEVRCLQAGAPSTLCGLHSALLDSVRLRCCLPHACTSPVRSQRQVDGWRFIGEEDAAQAPPLASLSTVTGLRFLKLDGWEGLGALRGACGP